MPPKCSICDHPYRTSIDKALKEGVSIRCIQIWCADKRAQVTERMLRNHAHKHLLLPKKKAKKKEKCPICGKQVGKDALVLNSCIKVHRTLTCIKKAETKYQIDIDYTLSKEAIIASMAADQMMVRGLVLEKKDPDEFCNPNYYKYKIGLWSAEREYKKLTSWPQPPTDILPPVD